MTILPAEALSLAALLGLQGLLVYCGLSSRRFSSDLLAAHEKSYVSKPILELPICRLLHRNVIDRLAT